MDTEFLRQLRALIEKNASSHFLLRPHPYDDISSLTDLRGENVRLLDNISCTMADLHLNRLMPHVDLVVTPTSTLVVDAAISRKPVFINATDRPWVYKAAKPRQFDELAKAINDPRQLAVLKEEATKIASVYADAVDDKFYERFSEILAEPKPTGQPDAFLAATVSLCDEIETWRDEAQRRFQAYNSAVRKCEMLEQSIENLELGSASLQAEIATVKQELEISRSHLEAIFRSRSWMVARGLQRMAAGGRSLFRLTYRMRQ